jgi:uncharacterized protein YraI
MLAAQRVTTVKSDENYNEVEESMQRTVKRSFIISLALLSVLLLAACGGGEAATPTPTKTPAVAAEAPTATATPQPAPPVEAATQPPAEPSAELETAPATEAVPTPAPVVEKVGTVTADQLNIRAEPSTAGALVQTALINEQFTVVGTSDDGQWYQVAKEGQTLGWVAAEFISVTERTVAAAPSGEQPVAEATQPPAASTGSFAPATMSSPDFGTQVFVWWRGEITDRDLDLVKKGGFNWIKQSFAWETIEGKGPGQFDWSVADRVVGHASERGLKVLARLSTDPELTDFWGGTPPGNVDAFANYAYNLAARYNCQAGAIGCIQAYQVWNEPNLAREWGGRRPNPAEYAAFLKTVYAAIKRGNPNAIVISAGMAPTGDNSDIAMPDDVFYDQMYQAMGGDSTGYFDMLGVHVWRLSLLCLPSRGRYPRYHGALRRRRQENRVARVWLDV